MSTYSQTDRPLQVSTPLGTDALLLNGLTGVEGLSRLFELELDLLALARTDVPFDKLLGQSVTVTLALPQGGPRYFNGIIRRFSQGPMVRGLDGEPLLRYRAEVVPHLWLWTRRTRSRVFQQLSVPDILKQVFAGLAMTSEIQGDFKPRDYCVQYRESDFAFASRLMEDEGIYYFFRHDKSGHRLVLANTPGSHPETPGSARAVYRPPESGLMPEARVTDWEKSQEIRAGKYVLQDYSFETPTKNLQARAGIQPSVKVGTVGHNLQAGGNSQLEMYDHASGHAHCFTGVSPTGGAQSEQLGNIAPDEQRLAGIRMEEEATWSLLVRGRSTCGQFTAGHRFTLESHFNGDGPYVLTRIEHDASLPGVYTPAEAERASFAYANRFECIPVALPFRPARQTPRPTIPGTQTAVVVGPSGEDIFADKYGRVLVQFFWDRQGGANFQDQAGQPIAAFDYWQGQPPANPSHSCWVRVTQPWAGGQFGAIAIPRIGHEVVVAFAEGDPDRPLIVGCVYNAVQMPPFSLPENQTLSAIKSHTPGGDSGTFSGLAIQDSSGEEFVHLHSERDLTHSAENTLYTNAGTAHHINIGNVSTRQVGGLPGINHALPPASSGSGGGGSSGDSSSPPPSVPPYGWNASAAGGWAADLDLVLGWTQVNVVGISTASTFGQVQYLTFNPLSSFLEMFQPAGFGVPASPTGGAISSTLLGAVQTINMGGLVGITYGNQVGISRGQVVQYCAPLGPLGTGSPACISLAVTYMAAVAVDMLLPALVGTTKLATGLTGALAPLLTEIILGVWVGIESSYGNLGFGNALVDATTHAVAKSILNNPAAGATVAQANTAIFDYLVTQGENLGAVSTFPQSLQQHQAAFTVNAPVISFYASPQLATPFLDPLIVLSATNAASDIGQIALWGAQTVNLYGQQSFVQVGAATPATDGIILDCGAAGTLLLRSGITEIPNVIKMTPTGIAVQSSLRIQMMLTPNTSIEMAPGIGIMLAVGETSIIIGNNGIILSSGGTMVEISDSGLTLTGANITANADAGYKIAAANVIVAL